MHHHVTVVPDKGYKGLNPIQFGYHDCPPSHAFGPAMRTYWLIHFVVSGWGHYRIGNREYRVSPGEMFVVPPYEETYYEADAVHPWSYIWIGFTTDEALPVALPDTLRCPEALGIFQEMKNCEAFSEGRSAYLNARLWDLFALLLGKEAPQDDYVQKALDFIHSEYMNEITVEKIASLLTLDRTYFSVLFKKKTGLSPKQYLLDYRMSVAASLLTEKKVSVSLAASSVGYQDIYTFSKMFKRHFGVSPKEYLKREREKKGE